MTSMTCWEAKTVNTNSSSQAGSLFEVPKLISWNEFDVQSCSGTTKIQRKDHEVPEDPPIGLTGKVSQLPLLPRSEYNQQSTNNARVTGFVAVFKPWGSKYQNIEESAENRLDSRHTEVQSTSCYWRGTGSQLLRCPAVNRVSSLFGFHHDQQLLHLLIIELFLHYQSCLGFLLAPDSTRNRTIARCPFGAATIRGAHPSSVVPCSLLAPDSTRNRTISRCPCWAATIKGVHPSSVVPCSLLAPDSTRNRTISRWPFWAAAIRGVHPSSVVPWSFVGTGLH